MPEKSEPAQAPETGAAEQPGQTEPKPSETLDFWKAKAREQEKRAKDNAAAAKRLAELEEANKSEAQKADDELANLKARLAEAESLNLRAAKAAAAGVPVELITASDEAGIDAQVKALVAWRADERKSGNHVPNEGRTSNSPKTDPMREVARQLFGRT